MIQNARMIIKRGNGVPTVPSSNDNNDGTWIATDIYEGEQYMDLDTGIVYTRYGNNIQTVQTGLADERVIIGRFEHDTVTDDVTVFIAKNQTGAVITGVYDAVDEYYILTSDLPIFLNGQTFLTTSDQRISRDSDTQLFVQVIATRETIIESSFIIYLF
jgi:hypothetical protein